MLKNKNKPRSEKLKLELYERCLLAISDSPCAHRNVLPGSGAVLSIPCPVCLAWCALNHEKAKGQLEIAMQMWRSLEAEKNKPKIQVVKG